MNRELFQRKIERGITYVDRLGAMQFTASELDSDISLMAQVFFYYQNSIERSL